jgi:hypothetical protein
MDEKRGIGLAYPEIKKFRPLKIAIIGVVLLLVIAAPTLWFLFAQSGFNDKYDAVALQIDTCLDNSLKNAILQVGVLGGHAQQGDVFYDNVDYAANYLSFGGQIAVPSREDLARNLGLHMSRDMAGCVGRIDAGVTVEAESFATTVSFENGVVATLAGPINVQSRFFGREYVDGTAASTIRPETMLNPVQRIVSRISTDKGVTDFDAINSEGYAISLEVDDQKNVVTVLIQDLNQNIEGIAYAWLFSIDVS